MRFRSIFSVRVAHSLDGDARARVPCRRATCQKQRWRAVIYGLGFFVAYALGLY